MGAFVRCKVNGFSASRASHERGIANAAIRANGRLGLCTSVAEPNRSCGRVPSFADQPNAAALPAASGQRLYRRGGLAAASRLTAMRTAFDLPISQPRAEKIAAAELPIAGNA